LHEHSWRDNDDRWHHETCISKVNDNGCPADGAKGVGRSDYTGKYTIVDITGYTKKDGEEVKHRLVELPAKTKVLNKFRTKKENRGSLLGQLWTLTRADANTPNTGDDLDHVREVDLDGLLSVVTYKGKSLQKLIEKANGTGSDAERTRKYMAHHFNIPEEGEIPMRIPTFNWAALCTPKEYAVLQELVANAKPFDSKKSGSSSSSSSDDVPF
jgi:hypothetical protein